MLVCWRIPIYYHIQYTLYCKQWTYCHHHHSIFDRFIIFFWSWDYGGTHLGPEKWSSRLDLIIVLYVTDSTVQNLITTLRQILQTCDNIWGNFIMQFTRQSFSWLGQSMICIDGSTGIFLVCVKSELFGTDPGTFGYFVDKNLSYPK